MFLFSTQKSEKITAPGLLKSHYSPKKPLYIISEIPADFPENTGLILHQTSQIRMQAAKIIYTSQNNQLLEIASHLFSALHSMEDDSNIKQIYIEPVEEKGLGIAIMDRIRKAAYQYKNEMD
ncbi:MAG: hypothetical protein HC905_00755 [Bacteroidales bacterium]|nr:hypothetical protein [Bacteroidales bacterium]